MAGRAWIKSNDALKMPKVLFAIIAAGVVVDRGLGRGRL
jgi:hypothetical protein